MFERPRFARTGAGILLRLQYVQIGAGAQLHDLRHHRGVGDGDRYSSEMAERNVDILRGFERATNTRTVPAELLAIPRAARRCSPSACPPRGAASPLFAGRPCKRADITWKMVLACHNLF